LAQAQHIAGAQRQPRTMNFTSYFFLSTLVVAGVITHAYVAHEQFYPAVVYLSTDKMCLAVMYNFAFALFLLFGRILLRLFIGTLRDLEVEQLVDSGRGFLADTILFLVFYAPTIDNREVSTVYLIQYICCVIFMKVFHLMTQIRVSHMFEVGVPRLLVNLKLVALMLMLLGCDVIALQYFYSVASRSSTFFTWILFEALTMLMMVAVSICKYSVHMVDLRLDNGWPGKSVFLFYIELVHDVVSMTLFLVFMLTFFVQNPSRLPIYMMADVIQVARKLAQRLRSFRRYRRISLNMDLRFADATDEEIEQNEHCVICRDSLFEASKPKKLHCGHIFHIDCLRSWLVMQQVCPTCRAEINADADHIPPQTTPPAPPENQAPAQQAAPQPPTTGPSVPSGTADTSGNAEVQRAQSAPSSAAPAPAGCQPALPSGKPAPPQHVQSPSPVSTSSSSQVATSQQPSATQASTSSTATCSKSAEPSESQGVPIPTLVSTGSLPPVHEIMDSLKRAEEIAKFLRQQTDFWMEQVRQIEQSHAPTVPVGTPASGNIPGVPMQWPLMTGGGGSATTGPSAESASAGSSSAPHVAAQASAPNTQAPDLESGETAATSSTPEEVTRTTSGADINDQMAMLRRAQQEQWERKRSSSSLQNSQQ